MTYDPNQTRAKTGEWTKQYRADSGQLELDDLSSKSPEDIDTRLSELYDKHEKAMRVVKRRSDTLRLLEKQVRDPDSYGYEAAVRGVETARGDLETAQGKADEIAAQMEPLNDEFERRGGWNRAFLVTNTNGHVHRSMNCSTCRPSTSYVWLTQYSGADHSQVVEDAREKACTECYPDAPTGPSTIVDPRKVKKAATAKKTAKAPVEKFKTPVKIGFTTYKTPRQAHNEAVWIAETLREDGAEEDEQWFQKKTEELDAIIVAISNHEDVPFAEVAKRYKS